MKEAEQIVDSLICEMALTLRPARTGLPFDIWISEKVYSTSQHHRPRLKVFNREGNISSSVAIDDPIEVLAGTAIAGKPLKLLAQYIVKNRQLLLDLWESRIDQVDYLQRHRRL